MSIVNTTFLNSIQSERIQRPNDVAIFELTLISYTGVEIDIRGLVQEINVYETLFDNFLSGDVILADGLNLLEHFPIIGREFLRITWATPGMQKNSQLFSVYRVSPRVRVKENVQVYSLKLCSPERIRNREVKISKSFSGKHHEIVEQVFKNFIQSEKPIVVEPCADEDRFIIPYWNPARTINWICSRARPRYNPNDCSFVFYETLDSFYFKPLDSMPGQNPVWEYHYGLSNTNPPQGGETGYDTMKNLQDSYFRIIEYSTEEVFNRLQNLQKGTFAGTLISYDPLTKKIERTEYQYSDDFFKTTHAEDEYPLIPSNADSMSNRVISYYSVVPEQSQRYDNDKRNSISKEPDWVLNHNSHMRQFTEITVNIEVPGDSRRRVGETVFLDIHSPEAPNNGTSEKLNRTLYGNFTILSIRHRITKGEYKLLMKLAKNSLPTPLPDEKEGIL